jgi:hypothetical protein
LLAASTTGGAAANTTANGVPQGTCTGNGQVSAVPVTTGAAAILSGYHLTQGDTVNLCVVVSLAANAPASLQGAASGTLTIALTAIQAKGS